MRKEKLSSLCDVKNGYAFKSVDYVDSGYRVIRITNVQKGFVVDDNPKYIPETIADKVSSFKLKHDDILISLTGNVGRVGRVLPRHLPAILNQRVGLIRTKSDELDDKFLFQYLNSDFFEKEAIKNSNGVAQLNLSSKWIENHQIPLPPVNDQIRIAYLLSKVEGLIVQRKQHLQQLENLLKSVFLEMFGPTNTEFEDWPLVEIKELAAKHKRAMRTGPFGSNLLHSEFTPNGDVAVLGIDNAVQNSFAWSERRFITNEKYKELENYRIFPGDVIITIMGTIGRSAVIPDDIPIAINTKHLAAITLNRELANPLFLSYSIHSSPYILNQFKSKNRGAIMSGLNLTIIKETKLRRPPIEQQNEFSSIHIRIDAIKAQYQKSLTELENLYGALSQKAFKGELDLSRIPLPEDSLSKHHKINITEQVSVNENITTMVEYPMSTPEERMNLLRSLFDDYLNQNQSAALSLDDFWQEANFKTIDMTDEFDKPWGVEDYDQIKKWIFELINEGKLEQQFVEDSKKIELTIKHNHG